VGGRGMDGGDDNGGGETLPETNVAPENRPLEKEILDSYWKPLFSGAMLVFGSVHPGR